MDLFKKGTSKLQSLNSRFLASNNQSNQPRSQSIQHAKAPSPAPVASSTQPSKLKLTTTRQSTSLRLNRDQTSSPGLNDTVQGSGKDGAADKKAPVWNKGLPVSKSAKDYTDDELKAMHGISLVSRKSNSGAATKEGRWDDSDEDDDWGDTIDFGDGTKVTIGHTTNPDEGTDNRTMIEDASVSMVAQAQAVSRAEPTGNPWKRPTNSVNNAASIEEFPPVNAASAPQTSVRQGLSIDANGAGHTNLHSSSGHRVSTQESLFDQRSHADNANKESKIQQSGDARYQYEQNTYDRHWQNPPPQTREIFNSTTGRFEQIEPNHKTSRRPSHHERKSGDIPPRHQMLSGDVRRGSNPITPMTSTSLKSPTILPAKPTQTQTLQATTTTESETLPSTNDHEVVTTSPVTSAPIATSSPAPLDPSSQEFIDMQKQLMAEKREQAIQRRKDQDAEEAARKERARKKAEELAALVESEKIKKQEEQKVAIAASRPKLLARTGSKGLAAVNDKPASGQKGFSTAPIHPVTHEKPLSGDAPASKQKEETFGEKDPKMQTKFSALAGSAPKTQFDRSDHFDLTSPTKRDVSVKYEDANNKSGPKREPSSPSRNVWGPIGSKSATAKVIPTDQNKSESLQGSNRLINELSSKASSNSLPTSPPTVVGNAQSLSAPSWSAFDAISHSRKVGATDSREYNVFDAADEVIVPERHRHSPPGQSQANRTSSRFFPSAATSPINASSSKVVAPFVSPALPPRIDSIANVHFEPLDSTPTVHLPSASVPSQANSNKSQIRSIDQVMSSIRGSMQSEASQTRHDLRQARNNGKTWLDTQTRSVWEIKPLRTGQTPRVRVPHTERTLDWSRKERPAVSAPDVKAQSGFQKAGERSSQISMTALPVVPAWTLPKDLETTSKASSIVEPLIPPQPSLKLPVATDDTILDRLLSKKRKADKFEQDRVGKFYTTRPALMEAPDNTSPIRIKTSDAEVQIQRRFGRRVDSAQNLQKKVSDVKRQPVNMSDAPGGSGFKRGFVNRVRTSQTTISTSSSPAPIGQSSGALALSRDSSTKQRTSPVIASQDTRSLPPTQLPQVNSQLHVHQPQPQYFSLPPQNHPGQSFMTHRESPQPQPFARHVSSPMIQGTIGSRIAPPGLSIMKHDDTQSQSGAQTAPIHAPRGPPGIVLPSN